MCGVTDVDRYVLNGREIKNLLRTALAISKFEEQELSEELIRRVLDLSREHLIRDSKKATTGQTANAT
jgi:hypothetical protein